MLERLLERLPGASVAAIAGDGLFVPCPASLDLGERCFVEGPWALDLASADERKAVIDAWARACREGFGQVSVRAAADGSPLTMYFVDVRARHGVLVGVFDGRTDRSSVDATSRIRTRVCVAHKDERAVFVHVDDALTEMLGWAPQEILGKSSLELTHPDDHERAIAGWLDTLAAGQGESRIRLRYLRRDGSWMWVEITNRNLLADPEHGCVVAQMLDVSDEMEAHEQVRARERLLHRLAETLPFGVVQVGDAGEVVFANHVAEQLVGIPERGSSDRFLHAVASEDRDTLAAAMEAALARGTDTDLRVSASAGRDEKSLLQIAVRAVVDDDGASTGALLCIEDVTDKAALEAELEHRATHDPLTGCLNRSATIAALERCLQAQVGTGRGTALLFVDLDGFKDLNDRLGHAAGDDLLVVAARRLGRAVRSSSLVGRPGGDEFVIVCPEVADHDEALHVAERALRALNRTARVGAELVELTGSVGVAFAPDGEVDANAVFAAADGAMYDAKQDRRGSAVPVGGRATASGRARAS